jgi:hypothetical protein
LFPSCLSILLLFWETIQCISFPLGDYAVRVFSFHLRSEILKKFKGVVLEMRKEVVRALE